MKCSQSLVYVGEISFYVTFSIKVWFMTEHNITQNHRHEKMMLQQFSHKLQLVLNIPVFGYVYNIQIPR